MPTHDDDALQRMPDAVVVQAHATCPTDRDGVEECRSLEARVGQRTPESSATMEQSQERRESTRSVSELTLLDAVSSGSLEQPHRRRVSTGATSDSTLLGDSDPSDSNFSSSKATNIDTQHRDAHDQSPTMSTTSEHENKEGESSAGPSAPTVDMPLNSETALSTDFMTPSTRVRQSQSAFSGDVFV